MNMIEDINFLIQSLSFYADNLLILLLYSFFFNLFNWVFLGSVLNIFGLYPRNLFGLIGVFFSPLLHSDSKHFLSNAFPFFILTLMGLSLVSMTEFLSIVFISHLIGSLGIWLFGRKGLHIGASGLISSIYSWLITLTFNEPSLLNFLILFILFIYFGSILVGILPQQKEVSWEGHFMGFISGIIAYFISLSPYFNEIQMNVLKVENFLSPFLHNLNLF